MASGEVGASAGAERPVAGSTSRPRAVVVSASRRTDIPQFYGRWFAERRRAGVVAFRTAFGTPGQASLRREDVLGYLFWTKFAAPFRPILLELLSDQVPFAFQYTVNGYGPALERQVPSLNVVLRDVVAIRAMLPGAACLEWRYDPIVLDRDRSANWHVQHFGALARELRGVVNVVNVSVVEPYLKTVRRMRPLTEEVLYRHDRGNAPRRPQSVDSAGPEMATLLTDLQRLAVEVGIELRACSNPEWNFPASRCASADVFLPWGEAVDGIQELAPRPSRPGCRCLAVVDIGMDNTCMGGCLYCYATASDEVAQRNFARHDPLGGSLR